jgi:exo-beta-1,3-glucanase (GH17 family)
MKTCNLFKRVFVATLTLFAVNIVSITEVLAREPQIVITYIPPVGEGGFAEGKVVWDELTPENVGQYAIIAILRASWDGGGDDYVKPTNDNYLSPIDRSGIFVINITTADSDKAFPNFNFYLVRKELFNGINGTTVKSWTMSEKYIGEPISIDRNTFWTDVLKSPESNIRPGFVAAGRTITLSCQEGGTIRYTLDGSDPEASSARTYNNDVFTVPSDKFLLIKAVTVKNGRYSDPVSLLWMPYESYSTPLFGLNVSLALNGEPFGYNLSRSKTEERMAMVAPLTKWVRSFGTLANGLGYFNEIAKSMGLRTMIGVDISDNASTNDEQLSGLRKILQTSPPPDLIAVGNETIFAKISQATLAGYVDQVHEILKECDLLIPVGSVDVGGAAWSQSLLNKLDFIGVNLYPGTWDNVSENEMFKDLQKKYNEQLTTFKSKCVIISETGTPHTGNPYTPKDSDVQQTPSVSKAANYLANIKNWSAEDAIPLFVFEAFDEKVKSSDHAVEEYFGLMDGNLKIHSFYKDILGISNDATLSSLTVGESVLYPKSDVDTDHTVIVANNVTSISVNGQASHTAAKVKVDAPTSLNVGDNVAKITVTAEDNVTTKIYTVTIRRESNDATLLSLTVGDSVLYPKSDVDTVHTVIVANDVTSINVNGQASHTAAKVKVDAPTSLNVGDNVAKITVTAEDGATKVYSVTIVRADTVFEPETNLIAITANGNRVTVVGNNIEYAAHCGETSFSFDLQTSPHSIVIVDNVEYSAGQSIEFSGYVSADTIWITSKVGEAKSKYILSINAPLNDSNMYYRRWDDVLAVNLNTTTNGGHKISEVRWYVQDTAVESNENYIHLQPGTAASQYYAEVRVDNKLRKICNYTETRSVDEIIAYPNPIPRGESLQLKIPDTFAGSVLNIYAIKGTLIKSGLPLPATSNSVNVADLDSGIYLLYIINKDGNRRVIKVIIE